MENKYDISESQLANYFLSKDKGIYVRMAGKSPSFDFLVTKFDNGRLRLFLVDTLLGEAFVESKIINFYDSLENPKFHKLL